MPTGKTRVGNWFEDLVYAADMRRLQVAAKNSEQGTLAQRIIAKIKQHNKPCELMAVGRHGYLKFNSPLMLQNAETEGFLSVDIDDRDPECHKKGGKVMVTTSLLAQQYPVTEGGVFGGFNATTDPKGSNLADPAKPQVDKELNKFLIQSSASSSAKLGLRGHRRVDNSEFISSINSKNLAKGTTAVAGSGSINSNAVDAFLKLTRANGPVLRNTFIIAPVPTVDDQYFATRGIDQADVVHYGQKFVIKTHPDLLVSSSSSSGNNSLNNGSSSGFDGQSATSLYLCSSLISPDTRSKVSGKQEVYLSTEAGNDAFWTIDYAYPEYRLDMEGQPVKANKLVLIRHLGSNVPLASTTGMSSSATTISMSSSATTKGLTSVSFKSSSVTPSSASSSMSLMTRTMANNKKYVNDFGVENEVCCNRFLKYFRQGKATEEKPCYWVPVTAPSDYVEVENNNNNYGDNNLNNIVNNNNNNDERNNVNVGINGGNRAGYEKDLNEILSEPNDDKK